MEEVSVKKFYSETMELVKELAAENGVTVEQEFTSEMVDYLKQEGLATSPELITCFNAKCAKETEAGFYKVDGFDYSEDAGVLDLFITCFIDKEELPEFTRSKIEHAHNSLWRFLMRCVENDTLYQEYRNEDPDMAEIIDTIRSEYEKKAIRQVRLYIISNGVMKCDYALSDEITITKQEIPVEEHVWDIEAARQSDVATRYEPSVDVDFQNLFQPLECIPCDENKDVKSYLAIIPAMVLAQVYDKFRVRLLNQNVRQYLGGRKTINKKMLETLRSEGGKFFAYNNGISSTAYSVNTYCTDDGRILIKSMNNWQIVNGGQTTNVIYYIYSQKKERYLLENVNVALKISEIKVAEEDEKKTVISNIARYANSQNQVKESDFAVNEPFMHTLKGLSLSEYAPMGTANAGTQWFFVRMRGEYEDAKGDLKTKKGREFLRLHPKTQILEKTDVAKLEMAWMQQAHISCLGGEKCFDKFWTSYGKTGSIEVNERYFHRLVAKQIIYQKVQDMLIKSGNKGYGNIIGYYTLATVAMKSHNKFDLEYVWNHQDVQPSLVPILEKSIENIKNYIALLAQDSSNVNISSAAKRTDFWKGILVRTGNIAEFDNSLNEVGVAEELTSEQKAELDLFNGISADTWTSIANWGKQVRKLSLLERKKVEHVAAAVSKDKPVTYNYAAEALAILNKCKSMGWTM